MNNKYAIGKIVTGKVTGIEKYGIFVNLDDYYSGLVHISEISDSFVRNIDDYVNIGEYIKALDFNRLANFSALADFSPTIILDAYKLSYK